jgi:hypothetical protein
VGFGAFTHNGVFDLQHGAALVDSSSTSNFRVALGGITPPAPRSP